MKSIWRNLFGLLLDFRDCKTVFFFRLLDFGINRVTDTGRFGYLGNLKVILKDQDGLFDWMNGFYWLKLNILATKKLCFLR